MVRENSVGDFAIWFFANVLADGFDLTGGQFDDPSNIWVFCIDSDPACGQLVGAAAGVPSFPQTTCEAWLAKTTFHRVQASHPTPRRLPVGRWLRSRLGHALGLPHPSACEAGAPTCPSNTLMWLGYITYPDTFLLESDKTILENSPFISPVHIDTRYRRAPKLK